jgi:hypothetical protein
MLKLTRRRPQPVGINARQQMIKSMMDSLHKQERRINEVTTARNVNNLMNLKMSWCFELN